MPTIRLDDDVFAGLKALAEPFVDTPNSVIRKLLVQCGAISTSDSSTDSDAARVEAIGSPNPSSPRRARVSRHVTQTIYENHLLQVLARQFKGRGDKQGVTRAVLKQMGALGLLTENDHTHVSSGETRAENTVAWGRNALKDRGLISSTSPRGTWELTELGMEAARRVEQ